MSERTRFIEALDDYKRAILVNFTAEKDEDEARESVISAWDDEVKFYRKQIEELKGESK